MNIPDSSFGGLFEALAETEHFPRGHVQHCDRCGRGSHSKTNSSPPVRRIRSFHMVAQSPNR